MPEPVPLSYESTTRAQLPDAGVLTSFGTDPKLPRSDTVSFAELRRLRRHPTVTLVRALTVAPAVLGDWSVEAREDAPDDWVGFAKDQFLSMRANVMESALLGGADYGFQAYEKIFRVIDGGPFAGRIGLKKLKPLLPDLTAILTDAFGNFAGFYQERDRVTVPLALSLLIPFRVEGTQWHGESLVANARPRILEWIEANDGAARYDRKVAGAHFVVKYPHGNSPVSTVDSSKTTNTSGGPKSNVDIARDILQAVQSSGSVAIPRGASPERDWEVSLLADGTAKQISFVPRLEYLDKQMVRAMQFPERAALEGKYGTKADAAEHTDMVVPVMQMQIEHVTTMINWHCLDQLLVMNFGEEARGAVWLSAMPLADSQAEFLRQVYRSVLENPTGGIDEIGSIDTDAMKDKFGVPKLQTVDGQNVDREEVEVGAASLLDRDSVGRNGSGLAASLNRTYAALHRSLYGQDDSI